MQYRINMITNVIELLEPFPPTTCHISQGNRQTSKPKPSLSMSRFNQLIKDTWISNLARSHVKMKHCKDMDRISCINKELIANRLLH